MPTLRKINRRNRRNRRKNKKPEVIGRVLERSPDSARIILLASNTFLADTSLELASEPAAPAI